MNFPQFLSYRVGSNSLGRSGRGIRIAIIVIFARVLVALKMDQEQLLTHGRGRLGSGGSGTPGGGRSVGGLNFGSLVSGHFSLSFWRLEMVVRSKEREQQEEEQRRVV